MTQRFRFVSHASRVVLRLLAVILLAGMLAAPASPRPAVAMSSAAVYQNPLQIQIPGGGQVESCADPSIVYGQDKSWYMYCTTDPLNGADRSASGNLNFHLIPILRSDDLVNWVYAGDVFSTRPGWVADDAGLWAPDIHYINGRYVLYYTASWTDLPGGGSAIGAATAPTPAGPWVDSGVPAVEPSAPDCCALDKRWTFDPAVIEDGGKLYIYFGSYFGGVSVRELSADGMRSDPATQVNITIANRYEGEFVVKRGDYFYLFVSATDCCRGPLTGYSIFVARSTSPLGPFIDKEGVSLLDSRVGGTPVLSMNGNRWVGPGHNAVFSDFSGQDWILYHAVDRGDPYFAGEVGFTRRPVLMDTLDWVNGWPVVRGGLWASDTPQPAPAAQPGEVFRARPTNFQEFVPGQLIPEYADEFNSATLSGQWRWVRPPDPSTYRVENGAFAFDTQAADLYVDSNNASVLLEDAPDGPFIVEVKVKVNFPADGCCFNYVQGGVVVYGDDNNFIKLAEVSIWETRQTEYAKELYPVPAGYPRYGNTVVSAAGDWTYMRIARTFRAGEELYTAYTSRDGVNWFRGGTWTHNLGDSAQIGLFSFGGSGFTSTFDYVRVYQLKKE